jgi:hypothetical protein
MNAVLGQDERPVDDVAAVSARNSREHHEYRQTAHARTLAAIFLICAGCQVDVDEVDGVFYAWDNRRVQCTLEIDDDSNNSLASIETGLDRAKQRGEVLELLVHVPGTSITFQHLEDVLAAAQARNLPFVTYRDLGTITPTGAVALEYDGTYMGAWLASQDLLARYNAHVTIFVTRYVRLQPDERAQIRMLADAGHDIESLSTNHLRGPQYVEEHGVEAYVQDEVRSSIEELERDGYAVNSYAYPFGARTDETDEAILRGVPQIKRLRSEEHSYRGLFTSPCP